jgi:hypothetical protein
MDTPILDCWYMDISFRLATSVSALWTDLTPESTLAYSLVYAVSFGYAGSRSVVLVLFYFGLGCYRLPAPGLLSFLLVGLLPVICVIAVYSGFRLTLRHVIYFLAHVSSFYFSGLEVSGPPISPNLLIHHDSARVPWQCSTLSHRLRLPRGALPDPSLSQSCRPPLCRTAFPACDSSKSSPSSLSTAADQPMQLSPYVCSLFTYDSPKSIIYTLSYMPDGYWFFANFMLDFARF